jgi:hypothetical protein
MEVKLLFSLQFSTVSTPTTPSCGSLQKNMVSEVEWLQLLAAGVNVRHLGEGEPGPLPL